MPDRFVNICRTKNGRQRKEIEVLMACRVLLIGCRVNKKANPV